VAEQRYIRLSRPRTRRQGPIIVSVTRSSLWLGENHLLQIDSNRFSEDYKRFYFRDIETITIRQTNRYRTWNYVFALLGLLWVAAFISNRTAAPLGAFEVGVFSILWLCIVIPVIVNVFRGPSCRTMLKTAVQTEEIPSLNRIRRARRIMDRIRPLITAAQGNLTSDEVAMRLRESNTPPNQPSEA